MPQRAFTDRPGHKCDICGKRISLQLNQKASRLVICNLCKNKRQHSA